ncbi:MAG: hypothetical protein V3S30_04970 [Thermoanaerobaculia bacterium]
MTVCDRWAATQAPLQDLDWSDHEERIEAIRHFAICSSCRSQALVVDPSLLLLATLPIETDDGDVQAVIEAVRALRRTHSLGLSGRKVASRGKHLAAACILLVALLSTGAPRSWEESKSSAEAMRNLPPIRTLSAWSASFSRDDLFTLNSPGRSESGSAMVYQIRADDLSLMMVVDETLDF